MRRLTEKVRDGYFPVISDDKSDIEIKWDIYDKLGQIEDLEERLQKYTTIDAISALKGLLCQYEFIERVKVENDTSAQNDWIQELEEQKKNRISKTLADFSIGDVVRVTTSNPHNMRAAGLPAYLISGTMKVIGFTKKKVKCDWDGGKPFHIGPDMLKKVE